MNYILLIVSMLSLFLLIFVHEFIHWITLKILGYNGKIEWYKKRNIPLGIGIRPLNTHSNFICAKDMQVVTIMPFVFGWMWFIPFIVYDGFTFLNIFFGFLILFGGGLGDIYHYYELNYWWTKPNKRLLY